MKQRCSKSTKIAVKADESPTVVLNRAGGATASSQRQPTVSPDPFRDVIKTEPAPDLPSLIEDMIRGITTARPTTSLAAAASSSAAALKTSAQGLAGNQLQHPPNFDFMERVPLIRPPFDYGGETVDSPFISKISYDGVNDGDASSKDTVSLTYDSEDRGVVKPANGGYVGATLSKFNRTDDDDSTRKSFRRGNTTEKLAHKENVSPSDDRDGDSKVDIGVAKHETNHSDSSNSSSTIGGQDEGKTVEEKGEGVFSFDSVLELLFSSNTTSISTTEPADTTKTPDVSSVGARESQEALLAVSSTNTEELSEETVETSSKVLDNEIPMYVGSLLKLAGCNIYGRMYRVGRIIAELSNPCLECRCAEIGVQCKPLEC